MVQRGRAGLPQLAAHTPGRLLQRPAALRCPRPRRGGGQSGEPRALGAAAGCLHCGAGLRQDEDRARRAACRGGGGAHKGRQERLQCAPPHSPRCLAAEGREADRHDHLLRRHQARRAEAGAGPPLRPGGRAGGAGRVEDALHLLVRARADVHRRGLPEGHGDQALVRQHLAHAQRPGAAHLLGVSDGPRLRAALQEAAEHHRALQHAEDIGEPWRDAEGAEGEAADGLPAKLHPLAGRHAHDDGG
mmetsp:Transcript_63221/g.168845  ORF Transcript_63221/g.168845 Transcript_63221/m.168845 type:complete len:246 (+) Transcript_63221:413-1150(+)